MNFSKLAVLLAFLFLSVLPMSHAVISVQPTEANSSEITKASFEKHLGRKLTFSEKIAFKIFNKKIKKFARPKKHRRQTKANDCAKIALKTGEVLEVDLIQISPTEVKYKPCNKPEGPEFVLNKKDIFSIQSSDGEILYTGINPTENKTVEAKEEEHSSPISYKENRKTPALAILALVLGILSLIVLISINPASFLLAILAVIFGAISKRKIKKNPAQYTGKGMANTGLIIGIVICSLFVITGLAFFSGIFI